MLRVLVLVLVSPCVLLAQPDKAAVKVAHRWYEEDKEGTTYSRTGYGSGVVVWSGKDKDGDDCSFILTNSHVAPEEGDYDVIHYINGPDKPGKVRCDWVAAVADADKELEGDLALLYCSHKLPTIQIATTSPKIGETVTMLGFPGVKRLTKLEGKYLGNVGPGSEHFCYADFLCLPGSSGSGVYYKDKLFAIGFGISNKKGTNGLPIVPPVFVPPSWLVPQNKMVVFLNRQIPKEMGVPYEKAPTPRTVSK